MDTKNASIYHQPGFISSRKFLTEKMFLFQKRRGLGGLPSRLIKGRAGSVQSGSAGADDGSLQDESSLDGEENEKQ